MGYKGRIKVSSVPLQRHSYSDRLPATQTDYQTPVTEFPFYIGRFEDIVGNLELWEPKYVKSDTAQLHPIYQKHPVTAPYIYKDQEKATAVLDLKNNKLTPFLLVDDTAYNSVLDVDEVVGFGFTNGVNHTNENTEQTDPQDVPLAERFNLMGWNQAASTKLYYGLDTYGRSVWRLKDIYAKIFENGSVSGVKGIYDPETDTVTVPVMEKDTTVAPYSWGNKYKFYNDTDENKLFIYNPNYTYGGRNVENSMAQAGGYPYNNVRGEMIIKAPDNTEVRCYLPIPNSTNVNPGWVVGYDMNHYYDTKTIPFLLKDDSGEYWFLYVTNLPNYDSYSYPRNITAGRFNIYLIKVKDMPNSIGNAASTSVKWTLADHFSDVSDVDRLLDEVFKPEEDKEDEDYSDDGADIFGPGDKLEDITNIDDAVGGDSDMTDELEEDDAEPNTSVDSFRVTSGLFGAFKLTPALMQKYTGTLSQLYSRSNTLVLGTIYQNFADRMTKNTTGVIMLPFDIDADCLTSSIFAMGNSGVMNDLSDWVGYCAGTNFASAPLITKELTQFPVSLGTIRHYYDTFLDFAPYSTASLYLPYIGVVELPMNLVQSTSTETKNLSLLYRINNMTGDLVVILQVNGQTINHWTGNCARPIQVSVDDNSGVLREGLRALMSTVRAGANVAGGLQAGSMTSMLNQGDSFIPNPTTAPVSQHLIGNSAPTGSTGFMDSQNIVLIVERPIIYKPDDYGTLIGYPTKKIAKLGSVQGFARVTEAHIRCQATQEEREELERILSEGVQF